MITNNFPARQRALYNTQCENECSSLRQQNNHQIRNLQQQYNTKKSDGGIFAGLGMMIGWCIAVFQCVERTAASGRWMIFDEIGCFLLFGFLGLMAGAILHMGYNKMIDDNKQKVVYHTNVHNNNLNYEIQKVINKYDAYYKSYENDFYNNARSRSVFYSNQIITLELSTWLTNHFCNCINAVDKNSYVNMITVPFKFVVENDKVIAYSIRDSREINLGEYRFSLYGFPSMSNDLETAALAIALSSTVQFNVMRRYPKDKNGGNVNVTFNQTYTSFSSITNMRYSTF